jgi:hypothetical protein
MLDWLSPRLDIALAMSGIVVVLREGWLPRSAKLVGRVDWRESGCAVAELPLALDELLITCGLRGMAVRITLGGTLVHSWRVEPPRNATRVQDCDAVAAMRFATLFDESLEDWYLQSAPQAIGAFLACAIRRSLADGLFAVLQKHRLRLVSMQPEFVALWNHWYEQVPNGAWFGICNDGLFTLGVVEDGHLASLRSLPLTDKPDAAWLALTVGREASRLNLPVPLIVGICGKVPTGWIAHGASSPACAVLGTVASAPALFGAMA